MKLCKWTGASDLSHNSFKEINKIKQILACQNVSYIFLSSILNVKQSFPTILITKGNHKENIKYKQLLVNVKLKYFKKYPYMHILLEVANTLCVLLCKMKVEMSQVNILEKTDYLQLFLWGQEKCMTHIKHHIMYRATQCKNIQVHLPNRSLGYNTQSHDFHIPIRSSTSNDPISFFLHKLSIWEQNHKNTVQSILIAIIIINLLLFS